MDSTDKSSDREYRDVSATEFKKDFGRMLEEAGRGQRVRISRYGRKSERLLLLREADVRRLEEQFRSPLDALRDEFEQMVTDMQSPAARKAAASVGTASARELGQAAVKGFKSGD